ncbi:MAG: hypothetical protein F2825_11580 [Actinobacteria bacterium]|nr:hypothetical protein [Actinomycetota bacterium]
MAAHTPGARVVIQAAPGAEVRLADPLEVFAPDVTISDVTVDGRVRIRESAAGGTLDRTTVMGSVLLDAVGSTVLRSVIVPGVGQDGIDVRYASEVLLRGNRIGPGSRGSNGTHVDCIQVMGGTGIRIMDNELFRCATQQLHIKPDVRPIRGVLVTGNRITGCGKRTPECDGYMAVDVRFASHDIRDVVLRHNVLDGALYPDDVPGLSVRDNHITWFSRCKAAWASDNTVVQNGPACNGPVSPSATAPGADYSPVEARSAGARASGSPAAAPDVVSPPVSGLPTNGRPGLRPILRLQE